MSKKIHFVGIGGIGVSSLARHYLETGNDVRGSDVNPSEELEKEGAIIFEGHSENNVSAETDVLIHSSAVSLNNPEVQKAKKLGIKIQSYPEALGEVTRNYFTIAVSGTHGKSTTTGMLALILIKGGLDPTVIIGTKMKEFGNRNYRKGRSEYLLIEADEHKGAFLNYFPKVAVINNIEEDHLDYYKDIEDILSTFGKYIEANLSDGTLIINTDDENSRKVKERITKENVIGYSLQEEDAKSIELSVPGKHNLGNALAALKVGDHLGIKKGKTLQALKEFKGTWRRFDEKDVILRNGKSVRIINDYAHHPTAIKATLEAVKEKYPKKKVVAVFQPHQYERTYSLFAGFKKVLRQASTDKLIITDIYTVKGRESEEIMRKVSAEKLVEEVGKAVYTGDLEATGEYLLKNLHGKEILVIMGAGDVYDLGGYIEKVRNNS